MAEQGVTYSGGAGTVVTQQPGIPPGQMGWMPAPQAPFGCPPGLEYLTMIDQLVVKQRVELFEVFTGCERNNKYDICNSLGQQVFFAAEDTDCMTRQCCGPARPFEMQIFDNAQREVIRLSRPLRCGVCCFPCCLQEIEVQAPPGNVVGSIKQRQTLWKPHYDVLNATGDTVMTIDGPCCPCSCGSDVPFPINSAEGVIGSVTKQWSGFAKEMFTDAETFGISFPMDLDVKMKAVMIGACFLIVSCLLLFHV